MKPIMAWHVCVVTSPLPMRATTAQGILAPDDAVRAVESGVDAIIVSNHGGRQLDYAPSALEMLPAVVAAVDGRVPVLMVSEHGRSRSPLTWVDTCRQHLPCAASVQCALTCSCPRLQSCNHVHVRPQVAFVLSPHTTNITFIVCALRACKYLCSARPRTCHMSAAARRMVA